MVSNLGPLNLAQNPIMILLCYSIKAKENSTEEKIICFHLGEESGFALSKRNSF